QPPEMPPPPEATPPVQPHPDGAGVPEVAIEAGHPTQPNAEERPEVLADSAEVFEMALDLHQHGYLEAAVSAYLRAEEQGEPDAAFNLGVLLYEVGDVDGAEDAWRRCLQHQHARAATNLGFLLQQRGDLTGALLAYSTADRWGDPEGGRMAAALQAEAEDR
ncbi:MAG: hypothetical protein WBP81_28745, partial [Solirubrobacteraceae bacterium]